MHHINSISSTRCNSIDSVLPQPLDSFPELPALFGPSVKPKPWPISPSQPQRPELLRRVLVVHSGMRFKWGGVRAGRTVLKKGCPIVPTHCIGRPPLRLHSLNRSGQGRVGERREDGERNALGLKGTVHTKGIPSRLLHIHFIYMLKTRLPTSDTQRQKRHYFRRQGVGRFLAETFHGPTISRFVLFGAEITQNGTPRTKAEGGSR